MNSIKKRFGLLLLTLILIVSNSISVLACDEEKCNEYVSQMLFGNNASRYYSDENWNILSKAIYICCEQADGRGKDSLGFLNEKGVKGTGSFDDINLDSSVLDECCHASWESVFSGKENIQKNRKKVLKNSVKKVFDFGFLGNIFGSSKCDNFTKLLYYLHIFSDYIVESPNKTISLKGRKIPSFSGQGIVTINNNKPVFKNYQKSFKDSFINLSSLDALGRAGTAFANIGPDLITSEQRKSLTNIMPSGFKNTRYPEAIKGDAYIYNRSHLIAHMFSGKDESINLITGTDYLNHSLMEPKENDIKNYILKTGNHVLYRVTPVYEGSNLVATGVQMEAYSIEDSGKGISFNIFCYNIQPGITINYSNGNSNISSISDKTNKKMPFAIFGATEKKPDLILELDMLYDTLFEDQKKSLVFTSMKNKLKIIANDVRNLSLKIGNNVNDDYDNLLKYNKYIIDYYNVLKTYLPKILLEVEFFKKVFSRS